MTDTVSICASFMLCQLLSVVAMIYVSGRGAVASPPKKSRRRGGSAKPASVKMYTTALALLEEEMGEVYINQLCEKELVALLAPQADDDVGHDDENDDIEWATESGDDTDEDSDDEDVESDDLDDDESSEDDVIESDGDDE